jgi:hypothetical protein
VARRRKRSRAHTFVFWILLWLAGQCLPSFIVHSCIYVGPCGRPNIVRIGLSCKSAGTRDIQVRYGTGGWSVDKFCTQPLFCKERRSSDTMAAKPSCETTVGGSQNGCLLKLWREEDQAQRRTLSFFWVLLWLAGQCLPSFIVHSCIYVGP